MAVFVSLTTSITRMSVLLRIALTCPESLMGGCFPASEGEAGQADDRNEGDDPGGRSQHEWAREICSGQECVKRKYPEHHIGEPGEPSPGRGVETAAQVTGYGD